MLGDPQSTYPVIHITGTNGKGSTARMRHPPAAGLRADRRHLHVSPHLERYNERIRIGDEDVVDEAFAEAVADVARLEPLLEERPSHFEVLTGAALAYFADGPSTWRWSRSACWGATTPPTSSTPMWRW